jgi:hypothetical protein
MGLSRSGSRHPPGHSTLEVTEPRRRIGAGAVRSDRIDLAASDWLTEN